VWVNAGSTRRPRTAANARVRLEPRNRALAGESPNSGEQPQLGAQSGSSPLLALTRGQALRLIEAENFARQVRLMAHVE
jgi:hypothetical protein